MTEQQHLESASEAPSPTKSRNKRPRHVQLIIVCITAVMLVFIAATTALRWPQVEPGAAADIPSDWTSEWLDGQDRDLGSFTLAWEREMNEALQSGDKDAFLANAEGDAKELLGYWWDGTREVGWDYAFVTHGVDSHGVQHLNLGMKLAFTAQPVRSSGSQDAGLVLTQMFSYVLTLQGEGDDAIVTGLVPVQPMPWDQGPIYVQKRENVVLFAQEDERALVDENIDVAQEAAEETFALIERIGGEAATDGFVATITDDQARFDGWQGSYEELANMEVAGFASATSRPAQRTEFMPAEIATGTYSSGSWVAMGPKSAGDRKGIFAHEFAHVLHESALPFNALAPVNLEPVEGFAEYVEELVKGRGEYQMDARVREFILAHGESAMAHDILRGPDAWLGYAAASSYFHFVEAAGASAWQLAMDRDEGLLMSQRAKMQGADLGADEWLEWVASQ